MGRNVKAGREDIGEEKRRRWRDQSVDMSPSVGAPGPRHEALTWNSK